MRFFEIILLIICTVWPIYLSTKGYHLSKKIALTISIGILILHLIFEGYRWQMIPIYLIMVVLFWCMYKKYRFFKGGLFRKTLSGVALFFFLLVGSILCHVLPVFELPNPTGEYAVGSQYIHLKTHQDEIITSQDGDKRELMIKVWYPAILNNEKREPYLNAGDRYGFAVKYELPGSTFDYLDYVKTHPYIKPAIVEGVFPTLIFSHGSYSKASGYYALIEEIVSQGYIVLNINHTYESVGTLFPDRAIKYYNKDYDLEHNNQDMATMVWEATEAYKNAKNWNEEHLVIEHAIKNYVAADITNRWAKDFELVIGELEDWNIGTFLENHMDLSKIGVFGHSQGGAAAAQTLLDNKSIKAGKSIDGMQWGKMIDTMMTKPFALIASDWPDSHPKWNDHAFHNGSTVEFYKAKILNSGHSSFMDIPFMINLNMINESGTISPYRATAITTKMVIQFFDRHLLDESNDILKLNDEYPDFNIELYKHPDKKLDK